MRRYQAILTILLLCSGITEAHDGIARKHINTSNGLSNNFVLALETDGEGFVWVGTERGLNRVGAGICIAYHDIGGDRQKSVRGNVDKVTALHFDKDADLMYVGTERGLCILNCRSGTFEECTKGDELVDYGVEDITPAHDGGIWLVYGNGRLQHVDGKTLRVKTLQAENLTSARSGMDDGQGRLYVGHNKNGMSILDSSNGKTLQRFVHDEHNPASIPGNNVRCIYLDRHERVWVGTDHGLALFNTEENTFRTVRHKGSSFDDNVYEMKEMSDGRLWVACDVGGISVVDLYGVNSGGEVYYAEDVNFQLSSPNIRTLLQDNSGNIWVGSHSTGVDFISEKEPFLRVLPYYGKSGTKTRIYAVCNDKEGNLWVNGEDNLSVWKGDTLMGEWTITGMQNRAHSFARSMMADSKGNIWLGMEDEGVIRFNRQSSERKGEQKEPASSFPSREGGRTKLNQTTGQFERIDIGYDAPDIHSIFEDTDGSVWIGSETGVCIYRNGIVTHEEQIDWLTRKAPVTSFIRLSSEEMLMSTQGNGILVYNQRTGNSRGLHMNDGLPSENINQALADRKRGVWLATNEGIVRIANPEQLRTLEVFDVGSGLADNQVQTICQDSMGRIWVGTYTGVACLDVQSGHIYNYNGYDNVLSGGFNIGAVAHTSSGDIAMGSPGGVCLFNPAEHDRAHDMVHPRIAACEVYDPADESAGNVRMIPDKNGRISLSSAQNTLRFVVSCDNFAQEGYVDFSYQMKGLDDNWYTVGKEQEIVFRGLRPNHYTFTVRAKLKNQDWNDAHAHDEHVLLYIAPPVWQSWWAYLLYALTAVLCGFYLVRSYKRKFALQASLEMEKHKSRQQQELNEERMRFFTNITHELRTPLTLILGPLDDMMDDKELSPVNQRRVASIRKSAGRLYSLICEILEFRKTESQNRRLSVAMGDIGQFVKEIVLNFKELNRNPNVAIQYEISSSLPQIYFDSEVITTIVNNLLSNAIKYTERGNITTRVDNTDDGMVTISVSDTGSGITEEALPHIFKRYYQAKGAPQSSGTGIGLALVKALADLHEAQLAVNSKVGQGSRFSVSLSSRNSYPEALHKEDAEQRKDSSEDLSETLEDQSLPTLLVVEDNEDIGQYISDSFCDEFHILMASNGLEGLMLSQEQIPDIIVSDVMMPKMDGVEMTRRLKEDIRTSHIPVILLTAKDSMEDQQEGYESGADSYLTKPFTAKLLSSRIRNLLASRRRLAELLNAPASSSIETGTQLSDKAGQDAVLGLSQLDKEFLSQLNRTIDENIMQQEIDMAFLTDKMAMSHSAFYRKVKALTGLTANEYVRKQRLRHCYRLIESGGYNVSEAAMMTGFSQMAHFRTTFRNEFGILPSEVKKRNVSAKPNEQSEKRKNSGTDASGKTEQTTQP